MIGILKKLDWRKVLLLVSAVALGSIQGVVLGLWLGYWAMPIAFLVGMGIGSLVGRVYVHFWGHVSNPIEVLTKN